MSDVDDANGDSPGRGRVDSLDEQKSFPEYDFESSFHAARRRLEWSEGLEVGIIAAYAGLLLWEIVMRWLLDR
jgi:hypothetical protein